jgi:predicted DNA-binding transcriptional regulator YafY
MARGEQLGRQWVILQMLITSTDGKSVSDLSNKVNCHSRTVYRDLEALQIAGFPIYTEKKEGKTFWCILETAKKKAPIPLSLSELMALYFGRDMLNVLKNTIFHDSLKSLFNKIKTTLPAEYISFLEQFEKNIKVGQHPYKLYTGFKDTLNKVNLAVEARKYVDISYFTMSRNKNTRRKVAPYNIWFFDGTFYLVGLCMKREEIRTFAFDRIRTLEITEEIFKRPDDFSVEEYMRPSFGVFHGEPTQVKIWFAPEAAGYVKEKIWHESQIVSDQKDGSVIFDAEVAGIDEIKIWIMGWGAKAKVLEPESLKEEIKSEIDSLMRLYD